MGKRNDHVNAKLGISLDQLDKIPFREEKKLTIDQCFGKGRVTPLKKESCFSKGIWCRDDMEDLFLAFRGNFVKFNLPGEDDIKPLCLFSIREENPLLHNLLGRGNRSDL